MGKDPDIRRTINKQSWLKEGVCDLEFRNLKKKKRNHFPVWGECHMGDGGEVGSEMNLVLVGARFTRLPLKFRLALKFRVPL